ncbi:MAG: DegV family protein [Dehalococcoidia bacterium]|nr:MAG: DegV family protein [Dehalococcoidia bacterium]
MAKVIIVTDSVACLPDEQVKRYGIKILPIKILFEGKTFRDGVDLTPSEAYQLLARAPDSFTTSPSSPSDYAAIFNELTGVGKDIFCLTISSKLSTAFNVASLVAEQVQQERPQCTIEVMDSKNATASQGFIALAAAQSAAKGNEINEVTKAACVVKDRVQFLLALETIRHAYRTGRIPKIATQMGSMLGVKPILTISNGIIHVAGIVRTKRKGIARLIEMMKRKVDKQPVHIAIMHTAIPDEAEKLKVHISNEFNCVELLLTEVSPIIGYSIGPGALGVAFYTLPNE